MIRDLSTGALRLTAMAGSAGKGTRNLSTKLNVKVGSIVLILWSEMKYKIKCPFAFP